MRIDFISNIVVFATALLVSVVLPVDAGLAGLAITAAINLTDNLSWFVRMVSLPPVCLSAEEHLPSSGCFAQKSMTLVVVVVWPSGGLFHRCEMHAVA